MINSKSNDFGFCFDCFFLNLFFLEARIFAHFINGFKADFLDLNNLIRS
ncbi:hypothetical protein HMPREF0766_10819 [Sphingobacterium spiritivorum ATCC 33861]|uniref:Uncharacterized protein n=1 Tax=Sphingobacterium spiritivorum ATCC 33861 TaxID=525373 RepID=D7VIK0_SPHSI|nr:hypothetical protein HMPREF0766_10819 [Sphingobacterium spiritivorum ATCC 33861]